VATSVDVRTAAGSVLSLEVTPADVIGRCDRCRKVFREGDWYCDHMAVRHGHPIAWLSDQPELCVEPAIAGLAPAAHRAVRVVCAPTFLGFD
jgi:hypothetical protein